MQDGTCKYAPYAAPKSTTPGYIQIVAGSAPDLMDAVAQVGPVAIGIIVSEKFQHYKSGKLNCTHLIWIALFFSEKPLRKVGF